MSTTPDLPAFDQLVEMPFEARVDAGMHWLADRFAERDGTLTDSDIVTAAELHTVTPEWAWDIEDPELREAAVADYRALVDALDTATCS